MNALTIGNGLQYDCSEHFSDEPATADDDQSSRADWEGGSGGSSEPVLEPDHLGPVSVDLGHLLHVLLGRGGLGASAWEQTEL